MMRTIFICMIAFLTGYTASAQKAGSNTVSLDTLNWYDQSRQRKIPVAIYHTKASKGQKVVIVNHGYGANRGGDYLHYSYLAEYLAAKGYFVVSIQHELPTDLEIPDGNPQIVRRPFWDRGADNILFTINELKRLQPELDLKHITLIGHSNGGDMSALFPQKYPGIVHKIITLDNRRMALPRTSDTKVYSLRSSDLPADEGVLPTAEEQKRYGMRIIKLPATIHNDMDNKATEKQRKEIREYIAVFLAG